MPALADPPSAPSEGRRPEPENELFLPIHGFVDLLEEEIEVLNHPALQRLGFVFQLGQSNLVFRGATHTRLEHVIGTLAVAQSMLDAILSNQRRSLRKRSDPSRGLAPWGEPPRPIEEAYVRLGALLHDIGHLPAGHTLEDELEFLDKHDKRARLELVLDRTDWPGGTVRSLRTVINEVYAKHWLPSSDVTPVDLLLQLVAKDYAEEANDKYVGLGVRVGVCRDIIGNTICADLLDYLHRDWYHIGKPRYFDKRLFQYMEIRKKGNEDQFVISLGGAPKLRTDAITAILALLGSRYELAETVLFHRTKCSAAAMLERAVFELQRAAQKKIASDSDLKGWKKLHLEEKLLDCSDQSSLELFTRLANDLDAQPASLALDGLIQRRLFRMVSTTFRDDFRSAERTSVQGRYSGGGTGATNRNQAMRALEHDFELPAGSLAMYCPEKGMNSKIAMVKVHADGRIATFKDWDGSDSSEELSGGHIKAQLARFERLWRVHVAVDRTTWDALKPKRRDALRRAIRVCVLGQVDVERTVDEEVRAIAVLMQESAAEGTAFHGREVLEEPRLAAAHGLPEIGYPSGASSLRAFLA